MSILESFILGIVQGFSEFLPISSSGHLVIVEKVFGIQEGMFTFNIAVHVATLIAVMVVYRKDILEILKRPFSKLPIMIVIGTIPAIIIGVLFKDAIKDIFSTGVSLGIGFIVTGSVLLFAEKLKIGNKKIKESKYSDAIIIGAAQALAIMPAISRSGMTITAALSRKMDKEYACKFSFLLSIPVILGAAVLDSYEGIQTSSMSIASIGVLPLIVGMLSAGVAGYFAVKWMIKILTTGSLKKFAYYVYVLGGLILLDQIFFGLFFTKLF